MYALYRQALATNKRAFFCRWVAAFLLLGAEIGVAASIPFAFNTLLGTANNSPELSLLVPFLAIYCALGFLKSTLGNVSDIIFFPITNCAIRALRVRLLTHVNGLSLATRRKLSLADVTSAMWRVSHSTRILFRVCILQILPTLGKICVVTGVFVRYGVVAVPYIVGVCVMVFVLVQTLRTYQRVRRRSWKASDHFVRGATDDLLQTEQTRMNRTFSQQRMVNLADSEANTWLRSNTTCNLLQIYVSLAKLFLILGVLGTGVYLRSTNQISQGDFIILHGQILVVLVPLANLMREIRQLVEATIDLEQVMNVFRLPQETSSTPARFAACYPVSVKNISFQYGEEVIFHALSFDVPAGACMLLKGANGSGKSTLLNLMAGVLMPTSGRIVYNEHTHLMYVPQCASLYNESLIFNITQGAENPNHEKVYQVLDWVGLLPRIQSPADLNKNVGDLGMTLSGGQRARIWLARALYLQPNVLLLDETLDSIDHASRIAILKRLQENVQTLVITSHHCDIDSHVSAFVDLSDTFAHRVTHMSQANKENAVS